MREVVHELRLRLRAHELSALVDHDLGHRVHVILLRQGGELARLDDIGAYLGALDRKQRGQPGRTRAMRSGWGDEHLDVGVLFEPGQHLARGVGDRGLPL